MQYNSAIPRSTFFKIQSTRNRHALIHSKRRPMCCLLSDVCGNETYMHTTHTRFCFTRLERGYFSSMTWYPRFVFSCILWLYMWSPFIYYVKPSSHESYSHIYGPLLLQSNGHRWISVTNSNGWRWLSLRGVNHSPAVDWTTICRHVCITSLTPESFSDSAGERHINLVPGNGINTVYRWQNIRIAMAQLKLIIAPSVSF